MVCFFLPSLFVFLNILIFSYILYLYKKIISLLIASCFRNLNKQRRNCILLEQVQTDENEHNRTFSHNELGYFLPSQPLLQAFLTNRRDMPMIPVYLPSESSKNESNSNAKHCRLKRAPRVARRVHRCDILGSVNTPRDTAIATTLSAGNYMS